MMKNFVSKKLFFICFLKKIHVVEKKVFNKKSIKKIWFFERFAKMLLQ